MMSNAEHNPNRWPLQSSWSGYSCSSNDSGNHSLYDSMDDRSDGSLLTSASSNRFENNEDTLETSQAFLSDSEYSMSSATSSVVQEGSDSESDIDAGLKNGMPKNTDPSKNPDSYPMEGERAVCTAPKPRKSKANTLKGQYRAIVHGYRLSAFARLTKLKAEHLIVNRKGSYVSKKRQASGKKISEDKRSYVYAKNKAYAAGSESFEWTNKKGVTSTYSSLGKYQNGRLIPIYKKILK